MFKKYKNFRSREENIFRFLFMLLILAVGILAYFKLDIYLTRQKIIKQKVDLDLQEKKLSEYQSVVSYDKFLLVKNLEDSTTDMPWFKHIPKIISIFEDLKSVDYSSSDAIVLSDFHVTLDEISLKGIVSNLNILYYTSPNGKFKSLLDRFEELDFIKDMTIKTYEKVGEKYFEFVLKAKVINDDTK